MSGITIVLAFLSIVMITPFHASAATGQTPDAAVLDGDSVEGASLDGLQDAESLVLLSEKTLETLQTGDNSRRIPGDILRQAAAVAVFPRIEVGDPDTSHGSGILIARHTEGWSLPIFVNYSAENIGADSSVNTPEELVLVFNHTETIRQLAEGFDFILGADATVVHGQANREGQKAQVVAYSPQPAGLDEKFIQGAALTLESATLGEYYHLNQDAVREYFGEEEQLIRQFLGLDQEINATAQGIDRIPESAKSLQQRLREYTQDR